MIPEDWIVYAAGGAFMMGYLIINQFILRWMINLGTVFYIWYYAVAIEEPKAAIITSVLMGTANCIGLFQLYFQNSKLAIPSEHKDIYPTFGSLPPGDFRAVMKVAKRYVTDKPMELTVENEPLSKLYFILSGSLDAKKKGFEFPLPDGIFVGEVAYLANQNSSATTRLKKGAEIIEWDIPILKARSAKSSRFKLAMEALISNDLARKVTVAVAPSQK